MKRSPIQATSIANRLREWGFTTPTSIRPVMIQLAGDSFDPFVLHGNPVTVTINHRALQVVLANPISDGIEHEYDFYIEGQYKGKTVRAYLLGSRGKFIEIYIEAKK